jgi:hypothetical protein
MQLWTHLSPPLWSEVLGFLPIEQATEFRTVARFARSLPVRPEALDLMTWSWDRLDKLVCLHKLRALCTEADRRLCALNLPKLACLHLELVFLHLLSADLPTREMLESRFPALQNLRLTTLRDPGTQCVSDLGWLRTLELQSTSGPLLMGTSPSFFALARHERLGLHGFEFVPGRWDMSTLTDLDLEGCQFGSSLDLTGCVALEHVRLACGLLPSQVSFPRCVSSLVLAKSNPLGLDGCNLEDLTLKLLDIEVGQTIKLLAPTRRVAPVQLTIRGALTLRGLSHLLQRCAGESTQRLQLYFDWISWLDTLNVVADAGLPRLKHKS